MQTYREFLIADQAYGSGYEAVEASNFSTTGERLGSYYNSSAGRQTVQTKRVPGQSEAAYLAAHTVNQDAAVAAHPEI